jgi:tetratricopeptide (TPR) repeat protein
MHEQSTPSRARSRIGPRWRTRRGIGRTAILGAVGGLIALSGLTLGVWIYASRPEDPHDKLNIALRMARRGDFSTSAKIANGTDEKTIERSSDRSTRHFLIGADARVSAKNLSQRRARTDLNETAANRLEESRKLKFPAGYEGLGNYLLGSALFELFRWKEAKEPLEIASERWPQGRSDSVENLIDIDLFQNKPDIAAATHRLDRWASLPAISPVELDRIAMKRMQIAKFEGKPDEVRKRFQSIDAASSVRPDANVLFAGYLRELAKDKPPAEADAIRKEALQYLDDVNSMPIVSNPTRRQAALQEGLIYRDQGRTSLAVSTFSSLRLASPFEPEFMAAGIEEIDALIDRKEFDETISTMEHLMKNFGESKWYQNSWMPLERMRERILASATRILDQEAYDVGEQFVKRLPPVCNEVDRLRLEVAVHDRWARSLQDKWASRVEGDPDNHKLAEQMEQSFRRAASALDILCGYEMRSPTFLDLMWRGIEDYHFANDFRNSNKLIDRYLNLVPRTERAKALLLKAKNHAASGEVDLALNTLDNLILSNPDSPLIYDAKLIAAKMNWNKGNFEQAETLITENLYHGSLRPESPLWKESLLELGTLMYRRGERMQVQAQGAIVENPSKASTLLPEIEQSFEQLMRSISSMEEGLRRFKDDPRRYQLLYMTAKAYRMASYWPDILLKENRVISEEAISQWKNQRKELLIRSRDTFAQLRKEINSIGDEGTRDPNAKEMLRNSYFGEADLYFHEGNFNGALEAYRDVANRFINEPESLEAFLQIARCQEAMGQINEMRRTLEMALDVLSRIPSENDERFLANTRQSRKSWEDQIQWMLDAIDRNGIN